MPPQYSIVIPAYNESARIAATLERIGSFLAERHWDAEIIMVNDGSRDNTVEIARTIADRVPNLRVVENPGNRGKGYSVRHGMLEARGEVLLFTDADLSSPIEESAKLFDAIAQGAEVAIGSRWLQSELQVQRQPFYRQVLGRVYNLMLKLMLGLNFRDTQCGFKAFTRRAAQIIFPLQTIERWGFDPEILYVARNSGLRIAEVPVAWSHSAGTRINPLRDGIRMFGELLKIRWNALNGKYTRSTAET